MKNIIVLIICLSSFLLWSDPPDWQPITGTQYSMILFARIIFNGDFFEESGDNMTAAFGPGGESDCRGIAGWEALDPNGFWHYNIVGNINGEEISFKIYDELTDMVHDCDQIFIFQDNATIGSPAAPYTLTSESIILLPPQNINIYFNSIREVIELSWSSSTNANSYYIYADDTVDVEKSIENLVSHTSETTWIDFDFEQSNNKFYMITASTDSLIGENEFMNLKYKINDEK